MSVSTIPLSPYSSSHMIFDRIFVTVGTTEFNELVSILDTEDFIRFIANRGCQSLTLQVGRGDIPCHIESLCAKYHISYEWYRFKDNINEDILKSSLIISHAGAGTIVECLESKKILVVCVNMTLMNNHQTELADEMAQQGYCVATVPEKLLMTLSQEFHTTIRAYPETDFGIFPNYLTSLIKRL